MDYPHLDKGLPGLIRAHRGDRPLAIAAKAAGVAPQTWLNWEQGATTPARMAYPPLAAALGLPVDELAALVARSRLAKGKALGKRDHRGGKRKAHGRCSPQKHGVAGAAKGQR